MTWFKVDDSLAFHHKTVAAGNAAMGLWVRAGSWSAQQLTDGYIPTAVVGVLGSRAQAARLVRVGLWDEVDGGYRFHQWSERQPSREEVIVRRRNEAERKAKARAARAEKNSAIPAKVQVNDECPGGTDVGVPRGVPAGVRSTRPDPTRPDKEEDSLRSSSSQPRKRGQRIPDNFTVTPEMVTWASERCPDVDGRYETDQFTDYWRSASGKNATKVDWEAAWRTWLRRAQKERPARPTTPPSGNVVALHGNTNLRTGTEDGPGTPAHWERALARLEQREAAP